ncbi:hypothetical protein K492DRAFT_204776 [Lichtheimia hyalospora FSU 10163]|nr:hypothetical protein K492DRAFT_204776 [Lichtheimia hyalospora FSU 10163]
MSVDHVSVSFSRLSLAKAIKTSDTHDGSDDAHEPWNKSVIFHQPHIESKMLQTMQKPMRRLLSRHFPKRRSAPISPSTTDDDTPPKHFPHNEADEPSPELSKHSMPRPIPQNNTVHHYKHSSMHRRTSSTPPPQSLSPAAAANSSKQPLRSCLKRSSKSADSDDILIEHCSSPSERVNVNRTSVEIGGNNTYHYNSHVQHSPTLMSRLDATHHRSRSVGDLHIQNPVNRPSTPRQVSDNSISTKPSTTVPSRRVSFRDNLYSSSASRQSAGISPDVCSQKSTAPVTYPYHQSTRGTRNAATTTQQYSCHQHESPEKKHVRIAEDAIRASGNNKRNSTSSGKEPSYNLKSSTDARRRAEILRNQRPHHHPVTMHTASSPYMTAAPGPPSPTLTSLPMIPLIMPSPSPHPTTPPPSPYGIPVVFHPTGATATPITGIHMMPSHHRHHHSHRRSMHQ